MSNCGGVDSYAANSSSCFDTVATCIVRNEKCLCTEQNVYMQISSYMVLWLVSFAFSKADEESCSPVSILQINVEYRDGIKSKRDKIGMPCTHSTVI